MGSVAQRVVSLTCSNTEIVCALGCADRLVGVDRHSDYPEDVVAKLPRVGPDLKIDVDAVAALEPDLVLASLTVPGHEQVVAQVSARALPFVAPEPISLEDVYRDIREIAKLLGVSDRGEQLCADMQAAMVPAPRSLDGTRILVEWWPKPAIVAGRQSWVHDLVELAGGVHVGAAIEGKSAPVEPDQAVDWQADAVVISWCGVPFEKYRVEQVLERPGWQAIPAVANGRVFPVPEAFLGRPGPRVVEGWRALREVVAQCG